MGTKPFQIKMDPLAHKRLKTRAGQLGITIGDMIENLLSTYEIRIQRMRKRVEEDEKIDLIHHGTDIDVEIMEALFDYDEGHLTDKQFNTRLKKLVSSLSGDTWEPKIKKRGTTTKKE